MYCSVTCNDVPGFSSRLCLQALTPNEAVKSLLQPLLWVGGNGILLTGTVLLVQAAKGCPLVEGML